MPSFQIRLLSVQVEGCTELLYLRYADLFANFGVMSTHKVCEAPLGQQRAGVLASGPLIDLVSKDEGKTMLPYKTNLSDFHINDNSHWLISVICNHCSCSMLKKATDRNEPT